MLFYRGPVTKVFINIVIFCVCNLGYCFFPLFSQLTRPKNIYFLFFCMGGGVNFAKEGEGEGEGGGEGGNMTQSFQYIFIVQSVNKAENFLYIYFGPVPTNDK